LALSAKQIAVIGGGITLAAILFLLPKGVVNKEKSNAPQANRDAPSAAPSEPASVKEEAVAADSAHNKPFSSEQVQELSRLKKEAISAKSTVAVSAFSKVAEKYKSLSRYDSAAMYLETNARKLGNDVLLETAAETYYEAFTLAIKAEKRNTMLAKCKTLLEELVKKNPANLDAKSKLALTYVESPNPMQGVLLLREVIQKDPDNELALFNLGQLSMRSQQFDKAVVRFEKLVVLHPSDSRYYYYLGQCYQSLKKGDKAASAYKKALQFNTDPTAKSTIEDALKEAQQ